MRGQLSMTYVVTAKWYKRSHSAKTGQPYVIVHDAYGLNGAV